MSRCKVPLMPYFPMAFLPGSRVLDVGCGSGRDVKALLKQGYDAHGVEPVAAMREMAIAHSPELTTFGYSQAIFRIFRPMIALMALFAVRY